VLALELGAGDESALDPEDAEHPAPPTIMTNPTQPNIV
jgi:hypothetical protein